VIVQGKKDPLYFEDLSVGQRFTSESLTVDEAQIKAFASEFDPQPFHLDEAAARASLFGKLVASGWHTAALTMRLNTQGGLPLASGVIGKGGEIGWPRPTRPGDTLHVESEILEIVPSRSRADRGTATVLSRTINQHGEVVQTLKVRLIVLRKFPQAEPVEAEAPASTSS
jgi:acyl dehydratase